MAALCLTLFGCSPVIMSTRFSRVGELGAELPAGPAVSPANVRVFVGTAPPGFTLEDNELEVEAGWSHRVLGPVTAVYESGQCDVGDPLTPQEVYEALQARAAQEGATALIYTASRVEEGMRARDICALQRVRTEGLGRGFAVVLGEQTPGGDGGTSDAAREVDSPSGVPAETTPVDDACQSDSDCAAGETCSPCCDRRACVPEYALGCLCGE